MQYVIKSNQNIYDVALLLYGDANYCIKLIEENPLLINLSNQNIANISVVYDASIKPTIKPSLIVSNSVISDKKPEYLIKKGQSIYDLAIMWGYGIESILNFIKDSSLSNLIESQENKTIFVPKINTNISNFISLQNKVFSTSVGVFGEVFSEEDQQTIFISEDGQNEFTPEI